eukprot:8588410-Pyramimonas_sp.AAC.1
MGKGAMGWFGEMFQKPLEPQAFVAEDPEEVAKRKKDPKAKKHPEIKTGTYQVLAHIIEARDIPAVQIFSFAQLARRAVSEDTLPNSFVKVRTSPNLLFPLRLSYITINWNAIEGFQSLKSSCSLVQAVSLFRKLFG